MDAISAIETTAAPIPNNDTKYIQIIAGKPPFGIE